MHLSRREKGALAFGVLGGLLWGAVAALRTRPLPAALRVFTNAGPNIACAFLAACLLMLGHRLLCRRSPSSAVLCAVLGGGWAMALMLPTCLPRSARWRWSGWCCAVWGRKPRNKKAALAAYLFSISIMPNFSS